METCATTRGARLSQLMSPQSAAGCDISRADLIAREATYLRASLFYRMAAVLILLFDIGHTVGFLQYDPEWKVDSLIGSMKSIHFDIQGFSRSYWEFFVGFGLFVTVFLLLAAVTAWQLGGLAAETLARLRGIRWSLAICFVALTFLSFRYFFVLPLVFSTLITVCLIVAALLKPQVNT
jgi:hypothetical protein